MTSISNFMTQDHRLCDDGYAAAEEMVAAGQWDEADGNWTRFRNDMDAHFRKEEDCLFPAFEARTGNTQGPTAVMRMEHEQMRSLISEMNEAIAARNADTFLGLAETLMILTQQHNMKEEQILYPMSDQVLDNAEALIEQMQKA